MICQICGVESEFEHDHKPDNTGLDDGPYLPRCAPRKRMARRNDLSDVRKRAWLTRRTKYGSKGHR